MVFGLGLWWEFGSRSDLPLGLSFGSGLASSSCDVDEVLIEENVKGDVRHCLTGVSSMGLSVSSRQ